MGHGRAVTGLHQVEMAHNQRTSAKDIPQQQNLESFLTDNSNRWAHAIIVEKRFEMLKCFEILEI